MALAMAALREHLGRALLVLASVLLTLGAVECGMRVLDVAPLPSTAAGGFRPDHPLLRLLQKNSCKEFGRPDGPYFVEVCTNELGLRDRNHVPGEAPRVLGIGDSFTFGWGVEQNDTFLAHVERALRLSDPPNRAGVFNAGLSYTSQVHHDVLLRHLWSKVQPDLVVVAHSEDNDIDENVIWNPNIGVFPEHGEISPAAVQAYRENVRGVVFQDFLFRHSALVRFFRTRQLRSSVAAEIAALDTALDGHGLTGAPLTRMVQNEGRRRFLQAFSGKHDDDWRVSEILLDRIVRFVSDRGKNVVLLRIPSRTGLDDDAWQVARDSFCGKAPAEIKRLCGTLDRGHTAARLRAYAGDRRLAYVDPSEELRAALQRGETIYLPDDIHLSRLGHLRVGEYLARDLAPRLQLKLPDASSAAVVPETHKTRKVGAYFYPWYRAKEWSSFTDYTPRTGAYLSTDEKLIAQQLHWAERGELDFFMIELLAAHNPESKFNDQAVDAMVKTIVERRRRGHSRFQFAILSDIFVGEADISSNERWLEATRAHLDHIYERFVEPHADAYLHVDGKPLVGIYSPPTGIDDPRFTVIRPYWVSHEQWSDWNRKSELLAFWDTYPQVVTDRRFVSVTPGYNDWRLERQPQVAPYLPRAAGRTFAEQWQRAFEVAPQAVLVYSYNEYFEQTHIEPTVEQGDRYLLLNQILARRFKDGRPLADAELGRLVDVLEPPAKPEEERVAWLSIDDPRITRHGLKDTGKGRAALDGQAEISLDADGRGAFVVGIGHAPTFQRCTGLSVSVVGAGEAKSTTFATELTQLSVLRDAPQAMSVKRLELRLAKTPAHADCQSAGDKPIVLTGIARYALATQERRNFRVDDPRVQLEGFWPIESPPEGAFAWSTGRAGVVVSGLTPGEQVRVTLAFRDTANFGNVSLGPDDQRMERVILTPGRTATFVQPLTVSRSGTLQIRLQTPTWRPSDLFGSQDKRALGLALRLVTLDRVDGKSSPHGR